MSNDDLELRIIANDEAGKVIDRVAEKAEKLEKLDPEIEISADGGKAEKEVKSIAERLEGLTERQQELVIKAQITSAESDIKRLERSFKDFKSMTDDEVQIRLIALDNATADLDEARKLSDDLDAKKVEIEVDVDVNGGGRQALGDLDSKLHDVRDSGDQSRSVLANMAGNTAQDLGEVGGVVGSLGVGLGQLAEYATEGNIKMNELAKVAGPMAGLAAAGLVVQTVMAGIDTEKAFKAEQVEKFTEALKEGKTAIQVINDELRETGKLSYVGSGGLLDLGKETKDLSAVARDAGLTYEQFLDVLQDSSAPERFREQVRLLRVEQQEANRVSDANKLGEQAVLYGELARGVEQYQESIGLASSKQEELNSWIGANSAATAEAARVYGEYSSGVIAARAAEEEYRAAVEATAGVLSGALTGALESAEEATASFYSAQRAAADAGYAAQQTTDDLIVSIQGYDKAIIDAEGDLIKIHDAQQAARDSATSYADAQVRVAQDTATANGETLSAAQQQGVWLQAMQDSTAFMGSEQKATIAEYIAQVTGIPLERVTKILAGTDPVSLSDAAAEVDAAAADRDALIVVDADTSEAQQKIAALRQQAKATLKVGLTLGGDGFASGGYTGRGGTDDVAGLVHRGEFVIPASGVDQSTGLPKGVGSGTVTNIHNYPPGIGLREFSRADRNSRRRGFGRAR